MTVRHHFDLPNATQVQGLLRSHGASLLQSDIDYTVDICWPAFLCLIRF